MKRIVIVGKTGSGKSTLAGQLSRQLAIPHIELDALYWQADWQGTPDDKFLANVQDALATNDTWVVDGNYGRVRSYVWEQADTLVWLDYPLHVVFWRLFWRSLERTLGGKTLWNGNRERFFHQFMSRESLFLWALKKHKVHRDLYPRLFPQFPNLTVYHFKQPHETETWLDSFSP